MAPPPDVWKTWLSHSICMVRSILKLSCNQALMESIEWSNLPSREGHSWKNPFNWLTSKITSNKKKMVSARRLVIMAVILLNRCFSNQVQTGYRIQLINKAKESGTNRVLPKYKMAEIKKMYWSSTRCRLAGNLSLTISRLRWTPSPSLLKILFHTYISCDFGMTYISFGHD